MADQKNPLQNGTEGNTNTENTTNDLLGDISLSTSETPKSEETTKEISDLGDILVEKSLDVTQQKAEEIHSNVPSESEETPAPVVEASQEVSPEPTPSIAEEQQMPSETMPTSATSGESNDPTNIDLGDIHLPSADELAGAKSDGAADTMPATQEQKPAELPTIDLPAEAIGNTTTSEQAPQVDEKPSGLFKTPASEEPAGSAEAVNTAITETPSSEPMIKIPDSIPVAQEESEAMSVHEINEHNELSNIAIPKDEEPIMGEDMKSAPEPIEPAPELAEKAEPIESDVLAAAQDETQPSEGGSLFTKPDDAPKEAQSETPEAISAVVETPMAQTTEQVPVEEKSGDMTDILADNSEQKTMNVPENTTQASNEGNIEGMTLDLDSLTNDAGQASASTPAMSSSASDPAEASVDLPNPTIVQTNAHGSLKKKTFAMVAAFLLLLVVGGFVFKTMMPEESSRLFASILGTSSSTSTPTTTATNLSTETPSEVDSLIATGTTDVTTGDVMTGDMTTGDAMSGTTTGNTIETPTQSTTPTLTIDEANATLSTIVDQSKKNLAVALKTKQKDAEQVLYKVFKDSSNLLETLANTGDISTIPDIDSQIANMQTDLHQATLLLNVTSSNDTQS